MLRLLQTAVLSIFFFTTFANADEYSEAKATFQKAGAAPFFANCYGYALFPTIGKGGFGIGGAHGDGRVYKGGTHVGDTAMTQVTIGLQLGGQAFSQIIFFENKAAYDNFTNGNFEFGAQAQAVALTASAGAEATTKGTGADASSGKRATDLGKYDMGMAVFTYAKGGLMYEASLGGQKFSYEAKK